MYVNNCNVSVSIVSTSGRHSVDLSGSPGKMLITSRNKSHYGELMNGKYGNKSDVITDRSPHCSPIMQKLSNSKFYGDFLTLTPRRNKLNEYLHYQQQSHEPFEQHSANSANHNYYQNNHLRANGIEHSYLNSLETLKLDKDQNILHSKLFYQSESSGNEYVISHSNISNQKKQHVVTAMSSNPNNIVSPPNQFNDSTNINRFIKL